MFKKIVPRVSLNLAQVTQPRFYAKQVRKERSTLELGLIERNVNKGVF